MPIKLIHDAPPITEKCFSWCDHCSPEGERDCDRQPIWAIHINNDEGFFIYTGSCYEHLEEIEADGREMWMRLMKNGPDHVWCLNRYWLDGDGYVVSGQVTP